MARFTNTAIDVVEEAFERCGIDPASLSHRHLVSARRSLNLLLTEIEAGTRNPEDYIDQHRTDLVAGQRVVLMPTGTLDVLDVVVLVNGNPIPLSRTTRQDDLVLAHSGNATGTPSLYWVPKGASVDISLMAPQGAAWGGGGVGTNAWGGSAAGTSSATDTPVMIIHPAPNANGMTVIYNRLREIDAVSAMSGSLDARRIWAEALCAGLAWKLSIKFAPDRAVMLKGEWLDQKETARIESRERGPVVISARTYGRSRRRRL